MSDERTLAEKIDDKWDCLAHIYATDCDDPEDVKRFRSEAPEWELELFNKEFAEYEKLKSQMAEEDKAEYQQLTGKNA